MTALLARVDRTPDSLSAVVSAATLLVVLGRLAGCTTAFCGSYWEGPIPTGWYPVDWVNVAGPEGATALEESFADTMTVRAQGDDLIVLSFTDPATGTEVTVKYRYESSH